MNLKLNEIATLPYIVITKDTQSRYLALSQRFATLLGWQNVSQGIGKTDYDIPCKAAEFASNFIDLDKKILNIKQNLISLDLIFYTTGWKLFLTERTLVKNEVDAIIGISAHCIDVSSTKAYTPYLSDNNLYGTGPRAASYILSADYCPLPLTEKQQACLALMIRGKTAKEMGKMLKISPRTVEDHMNAIKYKLNCQSKSELIEKAFDLGFFYYFPQNIFA